MIGKIIGATVGTTISPDKLAEKMGHVPGASGNLTVTDDGNGNITITATGDVTISDDCEGNVTIHGIGASAPGGGTSTPGESIPGEDGGYYTPDVKQVSESTMKVSFTASKEGMPAVQPKSITLPQGPQGKPGNDGNDYTLTPKDKEEIAEIAAAMVDTPSGSGLTTAQVTALDGLFKIIAYTADPTNAYAAFREAFGISGGGGGSVPATGITLVPDTLTFQNYAQKTVTPVLEPRDSTSNVVWMSSNSSVAKVENGVVTPMKNGTSIITAMANGHNATCQVTVDIANEVTRYTITRNLSHCVSSSDVTIVSESEPHTERITAMEGYTMDGASVTVTMGGVDISSYYSNGVLAIPSVTGNVIIYISAKGEVVNLFTTANATVGKIVESTGGETAHDLYSHSDYIRVSGGTDYVLQMDTEFTYSRGIEGVAFYDADKKFISRTILNTVKDNTVFRVFKSPDNARYAIVNYFKTSTNVMFFEGTEQQ